MQEWFEEWFDSPYYHMLYKNRNESEANDFVQHIIHSFSLNDKDRLLDLACGKGRHSMAFAKHGIDVTGIDLSKNSIEYASQFEQDNLHFYVHDMRVSFRSNYYDMVCNLFTSFGYFKSSHDNTLAARSITQGVKKGGIVLIDFVNRNYAIKQIESKLSETVFHDDVQFNIKRSYTDSHFLKHIQITDGDKEFQFKESLSSFTKQEMTALFQSVGLKEVACYGSYQLEPYNEGNSPRMILVFTK